ncbi:MAG: YigZ family protein [Clostridiales bacterium]|jgi:hypothetical protein|nr:YigZ family protein [Clostridiales bacterium]
MKEILKTLNDHGVGSYEEKRSQFIACSAPISSEEEALTFIKDMKGWHKKAHHYVYAYTVYDDEDSLICRYTDDREPQGTAGIPLLGVFQNQNIENAVIVVARYYGGIPLGAAGLTRAYRKVAGMAVRGSGSVYKILYDELFITVDYTMYNNVRYLLHSNTRADLMILKHKIIQEEFSDRIRIHMYTAVGDTKKMCELLTEAALGRISIQIEEQKGRYNI